MDAHGRAGPAAVNRRAPRSRLRALACVRSAGVRLPSVTRRSGTCHPAQVLCPAPTGQLTAPLIPSLLCHPLRRPAAPRARPAARLANSSCSSDSLAPGDAPENTTWRTSSAAPGDGWRPRAKRTWGPRACAGCYECRCGGKRGPAARPARRCAQGQGTAAPAPAPAPPAGRARLAGGRGGLGAVWPPAPRRWSRSRQRRSRARGPCCAPAGSSHPGPRPTAGGYWG
jgi:hypothetical protein